MSIVYGQYFVSVLPEHADGNAPEHVEQVLRWCEQTPGAELLPGPPVLRSYSEMEYAALIFPIAFVTPGPPMTRWQYDQNGNVFRFPLDDGAAR